jgi:hypothetical protein
MAILSSLLFLDRFVFKYSPQSPQSTPFYWEKEWFGWRGWGGGGGSVQSTAIWVETKYFTNTLNFCV